jgi:hypothetical protein
VAAVVRAANHARARVIINSYATPAPIAS